MSALPLRSEDIWRGKQLRIQEELVTSKLTPSSTSRVSDQSRAKKHQPASSSRSLGPYCLTLNTRIFDPLSEFSGLFLFVPEFYMNLHNIYTALQGVLVLWYLLSPVAAFVLVCSSRPLVIFGGRYRLLL